jgi:hypothetical protein
MEIGLGGGVTLVAERSRLIELRSALADLPADVGEAGGC